MHSTRARGGVDIAPAERVKLGYHASHEQFAPRELLDLVQRAEQAGFGGAMCSEHLFPWSRNQGHSGFAWSWLGAAMHATSLSMGLVTAPGYRYNPVITAHAAATLEQMFPARCWVALGSGEALNEHVTGERWPPKDERNARLRECAGVIRRLWSGERVTHRGLVTVVDAQLYSLPETPPRMVIAAITEQTARWAASWADGLITVSQSRDRMDRVLNAFRSNGGEGKPVLLQVKLSFAASDEEALAGAREQWATNTFASHVAADLALPEQFEELAALVPDEHLHAGIRISSDLERHIAELEQDMAMGYDEIYLHNVNRRQREFIDAFGSEVLPKLRG